MSEKRKSEIAEQLETVFSKRSIGTRDLSRARELLDELEAVELAGKNKTYSIICDITGDTLAKFDSANLAFEVLELLKAHGESEGNYYDYCLVVDEDGNEVKEPPKEKEFFIRCNGGIFAKLGTLGHAKYVCSLLSKNLSDPHSTDYYVTDAEQPDLF